MRISTFILTLLIWSGCSETSSKTSSNEKIEIEYLDSLMVDGCSQTYTFDSVPVKNDKYIFTSDLIENATIKINGTQLLLKKDTINQGEEADIWKANKCTVEVRVHSVEQTCDECSYDKGTITIKFMNKKKVIKIHGGSGC